MPCRSYEDSPLGIAEHHRNLNDQKLVSKLRFYLDKVFSKLITTSDGQHLIACPFTYEHGGRVYKSSINALRRLPLRDITPDHAAAALCFAMTFLESQNAKECKAFSKTVTQETLFDWWEKHKKDDALAAEQERIQNQKRIEELEMELNHLKSKV